MKDVYRSTSRMWKEVRVEIPTWKPIAQFDFMEDIKEKIAEIFHEVRVMPGFVVCD